MENLIETNEIWNERVVNLRRLNKRVIRLLRSKKPVEAKLAIWRNHLTDIVIDYYHQDMLLGVLIDKLAKKK